MHQDANDTNSTNNKDNAVNGPPPAEREAHGQVEQRQLPELVVHRDEDYVCYVVVDGRSLRIDGREFKRLVRFQLLSVDGMPASVEEATAYIDLLLARAFSSSPQKTHLRVARDGDTLYVDLANGRGGVVKIDAHGWSVISDCRVRFLRPRGTDSLPMPAAPGNYQLLRRFVRLNDAAFCLFVAQLTYNFVEGASMPIMVLGGEQGSAKTTCAKVVQLLCDPRHPAVRQVPASKRDLMVSAAHAHLLNFDNVSEVKPWLSDGLCTLATGGGYGARANHTDAEETTFDARRAVVLGGIDSFVVRDDLRDRTIFHELEPMTADERIPEMTLWAAFREAVPSILGGLFDLCSGALAAAAQVKVKDLPRMADFYVWACAVEIAAGWPTGTIEAAYRDQRAAGDVEALEADLVVAVTRLLDTKPAWSGTASELLQAFRGLPAAAELQLPKNAARLGSEVRRISPLLRRNGVQVQTRRKGSERTIAFVSEQPSLLSSNSRTTSVPEAPARDDVVVVAAPSTGDGNDADDGAAGYTSVAATVDLSGFEDEDDDHDDDSDDHATSSAAPEVETGPDAVIADADCPPRFRVLRDVLRGRQLRSADVFDELKKRGETQFVTAAYVGEELARAAQAGVVRRVTRGVYAT